MDAEVELLGEFTHFERTGSQRRNWRSTLGFDPEGGSPKKEKAKPRGT